MNQKRKIFVKRILKFAAITIGVVVLAIILFVYSLRFPFFQDYITGKALDYYHQKVSANASLGRLYIAFPSNVTLEDLYIEDLQKDTLLYVEYLTVQTNLWSLLNNRINLREVQIRGLNGNVNRQQGDRRDFFNYQFIIDAFKSDQPRTQNSADKKGFELSMDDLLLQDHNIHYYDEKIGQNVEALIGELQIEFKVFNADSLQFHLASIQLNDIISKMTMFEGYGEKQGNQTSETISGPELDLKLARFQLKKVHFDFHDQLSGSRINNAIGQLDVIVDSLDINNTVYVAKQIKLSNSNIEFDKFSIEQEDSTEINTETGSNKNLFAGVESIQIDNSGFRYFDHSKPVENGFDPNHLNIQDLESKMMDSYYNKGDLSGIIESLAFIENNGFGIKEFEGKWKINDTIAYIQDLSLQTELSQVAGQIIVEYPSKTSLADNPGMTGIDILLHRSLLDPEDIMYFNPSLESQLSLVRGNGPFNFDLELKGKLDEISIEKFYLQWLSSSSVLMKGRILGLTDINNTFFDLNIPSFSTTSKDILRILPDSFLPTGFTIPRNINANIVFQGKLDDFQSKAKIKSTFGNLIFDGGMIKPQAENLIYNYSGNLSLDQFDLENLMGNPDLGRLSLDARIDGSGFSLEDLNLSTEGIIKSVDYKEYSYEQIIVNGNFKNKRFEGFIGIIDPNLEFDFNGLVNLREQIPRFNFNMDLKKADLMALNMTSDEFKIRANMAVDFSATTIQDLNGKLEVNDVIISRKGSINQVSKVEVLSKSTPDLTDIQLKSSIVDGAFKGNFKIATISDVLINHFNRYFDLSDSTLTTEPEIQDFDFFIEFKDTDIITEILIPDLSEFIPGRIEGSYNSREWNMKVDLYLEKVVYNNIAFDSLTMKIASDKESVNYETKLELLTIQGFELRNLILTGSLISDNVKIDLRLLDNMDEDRYHFGGLLGFEDEIYNFQFLQDQFVLNYEDWTVDEDNMFFISKEGGLWINNWSISRESQSINLQSTRSAKGDTILVSNLKSFDLSFLGKFKETEAYLLSGILDGEWDFNQEHGGINADIDIKDFSYKGDTLGNITLQTSSNFIETELKLDVSGISNEWSLAGTISKEEIPNLNLIARITRADISIAEKFTDEFVSDLKGYLTGEFNVKGTAKEPDIDGQITFNQIQFALEEFGVLFKIDKENIMITNNGLYFTDFVIKDSENNPLTIDGNITSIDYSSFNLNLSLNTTNFNFLNTTEKDNSLFFGNLVINNQTEITGTVRNPKINSQIRINAGSSITYVNYSEDNIIAANNSGIVEFYDEDLEASGFINDSNDNKTDSIEVWIKGLDLSANINIDKQSNFTFIIDPNTSEKLTLSGDANLAYSLRPNGDMTLSGRYEVVEGAYDLNFYGIAKRKFNISKGSYIQWTGDPYNANMDIESTYVVRTSPQDLNINQNIPFIVYIHLGGQLLSPDISFKLGLEDPGATPASVQTWISNINNQESVLNRQVFSLIIFRSFIPSDPFSSDEPSNLTESVARNSISKLLTSQLNKFGSKIQGLELSFDLQSYQQSNSEGRTELELGVSKEFLDNRVVVKVAGNFDLEGNSENQRDISDFAGDIKIEYKLTQDGKLRLLGFRQNEYDDLLQGDITKTGMGIIYIRDYNTFEELFRVSKKEEKND